MERKKELSLQTFKRWKPFIICFNGIEYPTRIGSQSGIKKVKEVYCRIAKLEQKDSDDWLNICISSERITINNVAYPYKLEELDKDNKSYKGYLCKVVVGKKE